ncbi:hypothetical protein GIS00_11855 [Nakamurella sp. YIM 132087]|uniref:ANTAR domain-containing protein n=1 Tax=Nakamurella alba TaxID=2665158 RepID=A0A7K1FKG9_9ACTN|nr:hypothetical protein [Nakamurella alba]MTD14637.1 hypothetical protein [Nakamurella alba]
MNPAQVSGDLALEFLALHSSLRADRDGDHPLQRLVDLAVDAVPGCDWAGITAWPAGARPESLWATSHLIGELDHLQYSLRQGPCLSVGRSAGFAAAGDLADGGPWPAFARRAVEGTPVRGVLAVRVSEEPAVVLELCSGTPGGLDAPAFERAALLAAHALVLLVHRTPPPEPAGLHLALTAGRQIGVAVGVLMRAYGVGAQQASALLCSSSTGIRQVLAENTLSPS